jgi:hypothetical protein
MVPVQNTPRKGLRIAVIGAQPILLKMAVSDVVTAATFDEVHMAA